MRVRPPPVAQRGQQDMRHPMAEASASTAQRLAEQTARATNVLGTDSKVPGADSKVLGTAGKRWTATSHLRPRSAVRRRPLKSTTTTLGERGVSWRAPRPSARAATHPTRHASIWNNPFSFPQHLPRTSSLRFVWEGVASQRKSRPALGHPRCGSRNYGKVDRL
jgi:hypothetical protein